MNETTRRLIWLGLSIVICLFLFAPRVLPRLKRSVYRHAAWLKPDELRHVQFMSRPELATSPNAPGGLVTAKVEGELLNGSRTTIRMIQMQWEFRAGNLLLARRIVDAPISILPGATGHVQAEVYDLPNSTERADQKEVTIIGAS